MATTVTSPSGSGCAGCMSGAPPPHAAALIPSATPIPCRIAIATAQPKPSTSATAGTMRSISASVTEHIATRIAPFMGTT